LRLFRVFPYLATAAPYEPGGVFFRSAGGRNRADSPAGAYRCLYAGDTAEGSVAETFGRFDTWDSALVEADPATPFLPGSRFALAAFDSPNGLDIRQLDDAQALLDEALRPSQVVTRDRSISQAWAARIQAAGRYAGVAWWSYYDSSWHSYALWDIARLSLVGSPRILRNGDDEVARAAATIGRRLIR
jgi:hypothetical protein